MAGQNVVFIVLDSLRRDKLSVYNDKVDFTENIQEFSEDTAVYENAVANSSWTFPSHASMFTGMYPWEHGATQRNLSLDVEKPLLAERLNEEGYRSAVYTTNAWLSGKFGVTDGFDKVDNLSSTGFSEFLTKIRRMMDEWLASAGNERIKRHLVRAGNYLFHYRSNGTKTDQILERGENFVKNGEDPFFLFMNLMDPHEPYFPPEKYREKHDAPEPREVCQDPTDYHFGRKDPDFEKINRIYDASIDHMDDMLGGFFDFLKDEDLWEDTLIVIVSDHGQMLGENGEYGHQFSVSDPLIHMPLMIKGEENENVEEQVELRKLYDIVLEALDIKESEEISTDCALGGYDFPDMMRPRIPPKEWKKYYKRHTFARTLKGKIIESEDEDREKNERFEYGEEKDEELKDKLREQLRQIEYSEKDGEGLEEKEEEIKKQLEELGYGQQ